MSSSAKPAWMKVVNDALEHKDNKEDINTRNIVLATVQDGQPFARFHVHRGFVKDRSGEEHPLLVTTTDMAMPKVEQIKSSSAGPKKGSPGEYVFWMSPTGDQIRIRGQIHLYEPTTPISSQSVSTLDVTSSKDFDWEEFRKDVWQNKMSGHLRASYLNTPPGKPVDEDFKEPSKERIDPDEQPEAEEALKRFALVIFDPTVVDWSQQNAKPPVRRTWTRVEKDTWKEQRVAI
ncbi:hypothetical protein OIV83_001869 [Microbotryomycetes sp. JL201]|nr:hypothetical protein OIV83_001869 [Microbotryomycetes sp. JL201]